MMEPAALNTMWSLAILKKYSWPRNALFTVRKIPRITLEKLGEKFYIVRTLIFFYYFKFGDATYLLKMWLLTLCPLKHEVKVPKVYVSS